MSPVYTPAPEAETLIPGLPNDVAVNIISRIPRSYHPFLCPVSRAFRFLFLTSRHLLGSAVPTLYLIIRSNSPPNLHFFTLRDPAPDPQNGQRRRFVAIQPIEPIPSSCTYTSSAYAVLGPELYVLGGSNKDMASREVRILDCRFNTWRPGPSMLVARKGAAAGVVNGKIYVMGGCGAGSWTANWAEALDPRTGTWVAVPSPDKVRDKWMRASAVVDGRIYAMARRGGIMYDPRSKLWAPVESELNNGWKGSACCMVDGILYCYDNLGKIQGFDWREGTWKELKGVERRFVHGATMANRGGNLVVFWEGKEEVVRNGKEMKFWCAEIEARKDCDGELVGRIHWSEPVLTVPAGSLIVHCAAVAL